MDAQFWSEIIGGGTAGLVMAFIFVGVMAFWYFVVREVTAAILKKKG
jgi:hypothetical protein